MHYLRQFKFIHLLSLLLLQCDIILLSWNERPDLYFPWALVNKDMYEEERVTACEQMQENGW